MTTLVYDRRTKTIGVDSRDTDSSGQCFSVDKIERISGGRYFLGSGHCYTINLAKRWADSNYSEEEWPDFSPIRDDEEKYGMSCLIISEDGEHVTLLDSELVPMEVFDDIVATGSGGMIAKAAILAGASVERAIEIAIELDTNSGGPVRLHRIDPLH
jgi:hypothetical protein